ncbi:hypothetical protein [Roseobacter sp. A03A-229]
MGRLIAALLLLIWPLTAAAQQVWTPGSYDNGDFFFGTATLPDFSVSLSCGERSPMRPDWRGPQELHATVTAPGAIQMRFSKQVLGPPRDELSAETRAVTIFAGGGTYQLPPVGFNYFDDAWTVQLSAFDPFFPALTQANGFQVDSLLGRVNIPTTGLQGAWLQLIAFCEGKFRDIGMGWGSSPPGAAGPAPQPPAGSPAQPSAPQPQSDAMVETAYTHVAQVCGRDPATLGPGHLLIGNIDGDGRNDVVIWWDAIDCGPPIRRPVCGAAQCLVETFLTAAWSGTPEQFYASSASVVRGSNGLDLLQTTGRLAVCNDPAAPPDCTFYHGWSGGRFQRLN